MTDLLPINATKQERALSLSTGRVGDVPVPLASLWSPQTCPVGILPWLAWALSVDEWNANWTEQQKRDAIAASVEVHRKKGTIGALKKALQAVGYEVTVNEQTGQAYTFRLQVDVTDIGLTSQLNEALAQARRIALSTKNARSYLADDEVFARTATGTLQVACITMDGVDTEVLPDPVIYPPPPIPGDEPPIIDPP